MAMLIAMSSQRNSISIQATTLICCQSTTTNNNSTSHKERFTSTFHAIDIECIALKCTLRAYFPLKTICAL